MPLIDLIGRLTINVDALNKKKISCFKLAQLPKAKKLSLARVCIRDNPDTNKAQLSRILKINRSTLYVSQIKDDSDKVLAFNITELLKSNPFYGYRRVAIYFKWSDNKARRLMRKYSISPRYKKPRFLVKKDDLGNEPSKLQNTILQEYTTVIKEVSIKAINIRIT
jgi:hypothetical protein